MAYRKMSREERLEREADRLLMEDRHEHCDNMCCKRDFYLDRQMELREKREQASGLRP